MLLIFMDKILVVPLGGQISLGYAGKKLCYNDYTSENLIKDFDFWKNFEFNNDYSFFQEKMEIESNDRDVFNELLLSLFESTKKYDKIILLHGLESMLETAKFISENKISKKKKVCLVGSHIPYSNKKEEALINFTTAVTGIQIVPSGVYIANQGSLYNYDEVEFDKNHSSFFKLNK